VVRRPHRLGRDGGEVGVQGQVLRGANQQVIDKLGGDLRPGVDSLQMARLAGGVATVADAGDLPPQAVHPMLAVIADGLLR
jgi:hypothetical protein